MLIKKIMIIAFCFILLTVLSCSLFDNSLNLHLPPWISKSNPSNLADDNDNNSRIFIVNAPLNDVYVNLTHDGSGDGIITIPGSVIIKKSTTYTNFKIEPLNTTVEGGPLQVIIRAIAKGYTETEAEVYVDSDPE